MNGVEYKGLTAVKGSELYRILTEKKEGWVQAAAKSHSETLKRERELLARLP